MHALLDPVVFVLVGAIVVVLVAAVRRDNRAAVVNTIGVLAAVVAPTLVAAGLRLATDWSLHPGSELTLWIAAAGLLHAMGMLGLYDSVWWWDHVTHLVSGTLVAALIYAGLLVFGRPGGVELASSEVALLTVGGTALAGIFWELIEVVAREIGNRIGIEPVLKYYGPWDTVLDLVFDVVGALVVVGLDLRVFVSIADQSPPATRAVVVGGGGLLVVGSVLMAAGVRLAPD